MTDEWGLFKLDEASVTAEEVDLVVNSVSPMTDINPAGGTICTLDGDNFPSSLDARYNLQIIFDGSTSCEV